MAAFGQTIAVVDRSGKVISTSKHLINVFKEAKDAYRERKAEIVAGRQADQEERRVRRALKAYTIDSSSDAHSTTSSSKAPHRTKTTSKSRRPEAGSRRHSSNNNNHHHYSSGNERSQPPSPLRYSHDLDTSRPDLTRRHTTKPYDNDGQLLRRRPQAPRSQSIPGPSIDMDLAYGELPPPLPITPPATQSELKALFSKAHLLLDEAHCVQYSVTTIIDSLQKNPDALAAVALTLAEISKIVKTLSPGMLLSLKSAFPAIFALLASPQFLIAAGVGVGVTVVALGGYKIVKRIQARNALEEEEQGRMDELQEVGTDVERIEVWRRGIEVGGAGEGDSAGESVEGEFITPEAVAIKKAVEKERRKKKDGKGSSRGGREREREKEGKEKKSRKEGRLQLFVSGLR